MNNVYSVKCAICGTALELVKILDAVWDVVIEAKPCQHCMDNAVREASIDAEDAQNAYDEEFELQWQ